MLCNSKRSRSAAGNVHAPRLSIKWGALPCFICGIGGWDTAIVLGIFFGLCTLGFIMLFIWSLFTRQFTDANALSDAPLRAEEYANAQIEKDRGIGDAERG